MNPGPLLISLSVLCLAVTRASAQHAHRHDHPRHAHSASHDSEGANATREVSRKQARKTSPKKSPGTPAAVKTAPSHAHAASGGPHAGHVHRDLDHSGHSHSHHGIETESLFGFVLGSDVEPRGARSVAIEAIGRFGKRAGSYGAWGGKAEFAYGLTDNLSIAGAVLGAWYDINNVPGFENISRVRLNGLGGEVRWRVLDRAAHGVGLTLHVEPVWATSDELTGAPARKWGAENKIILDAMLMPDKVYAAFNLIHEMEVVKERGALETERVAKIGVGAAVAGAVTENVFVGAEVRYLHAYEGLGFDAFAGRALFVGPTLHAKLNGGLWASLAWNVQVAGAEKGVAGNLDLTNFEKHMVRVKIGYDF